MPASASQTPTTVRTAHDTASVSDAIREAAAGRVPLRIRAGGGWLEAGRPPSVETQLLDVGMLRGILEYTPGDLTLTARAGTTLAEIDDATGAHGQWLPLDPFGAPTDTLGATLATASSGPMGASLGLPRDLALGMEFVDGRGIVLRGGGRVVKNVAGFDLVRLMVGAWGTLGVITEATVRLRARPECCGTVALQAPGGVDSLSLLLRALREGPLTPIATELLCAATGSAIGIETAHHDVILVRLAGNATAVAAQRRYVETLGISQVVPEGVWEELRRILPARAASLRVSHRPARLAALWHELATVAGGTLGCLRHANVERGVARCVVPQGAASALTDVLPRLLASWRVVGEVLPVDAWRMLPTTGIDRLARGTRAAFDPLQLLNPGLMDASA